MAAKKKLSKLTKALLETADDMLECGVMSKATHEKITLRHLGEIRQPRIDEMSGDDIRRVRENANLSQAVFARYLKLTVGYVSQIERGTKRPTGPALVLLNVIKRKGIEAIL